jgi:predicted nucleic-acid-binding Zn-ribbon protein
MECIDCGNKNEFPNGQQIHVTEFLQNDIDVDESMAFCTQIECRDCGAVLGYLGAGAAVGSKNVRGYY